MTTFNEFWKEKAQKRRKSWAAKAKRIAEQHNAVGGHPQGGVSSTGLWCEFQF